MTTILFGTHYFSANNYFEFIIKTHLNVSSGGLHSIYLENLCYNYIGILIITKINYKWLVGWVLWHINFYANNQFYFKQFGLA